MIPTLIIAAVVLPFIITFFIVKVAESHAIQDTEKKYKKHIFRISNQSILALGLYVFIFIIMGGLLCLFYNIAVYMLLIIIPVFVSMGYYIFFKFLAGKPIVFIGDGMLIIKYLNDSFTPVLKASFSQLSYCEPEEGVFVLYVLKEKAFEINIRVMKHSKKLENILRNSLPLETLHFKGKTIIELGVGKEELWNEAFPEEIATYQKQAFPFSLKEIERICQLFEQKDQVDSATIYDASFQDKTIRPNSEYNIALSGNDLTPSAIVEMSHELDNLNLPYLLKLVKFDDKYIRACIQAEGITIFQRKGASALSEISVSSEKPSTSPASSEKPATSPVSSEKPATSPASSEEVNTHTRSNLSPHIICAILFGLLFIGVYISFFIKGEYNEWYLLILGIMSIIGLCISGNYKVSFTYLVFGAICFLTSVAGEYFLNQKTLNGERIVYGRNIGKPANYFEFYFTNDYEEDLVYKGEYKDFREGKRSTRHFHGKGVLYKKYTFLTKAYRKNGECIQHKKKAYKLVYSGTYKESERHGTGSYYWYDNFGYLEGKYTGAFVNSERTGKGTYYWFHKNRCTHIYKGDFLNGERTGHGNFYYPIDGDTTNLQLANRK